MGIEAAHGGRTSLGANREMEAQQLHLRVAIVTICLGIPSMTCMRLCRLYFSNSKSISSNSEISRAQGNRRGITHSRKMSQVAHTSIKLIKIIY